MAENTGIQWAGMLDPITGEFKPGGTLNIGGGCTKAKKPLSGGCKFCYAMKVTMGLDSKMRGADPLNDKYANLTKLVSGNAQWTNKVVMYPERIDKFLRKQKGQSWFACSLTDFWHEGYPDEYLAKWLAAFAISNRQTIYLLTKRPERQMEFLTTKKDMIMAEAEKLLAEYPKAKHLSMPTSWPLPNLWCGVSTCDHEALVYALPWLLKTPAIVQWLSIEPMVGAVDLIDALEPYTADERKSLTWAIFGGESGKQSRPMDLEWVRNGVRDCRILGISPFVKQKGEVLARAMNCVDVKGGDINEWPEDIRVREYPQHVTA